MGNWSEVCQITNLPLYYMDECYVFLVENVNPTQKIPVSSGMGAKYKLVCAPIIGVYDELGGLRSYKDPYKTFKIFQNKARCFSESFSDISGCFYDHPTYHLVWVKKDIFDTLLEKPYIVDSVTRDISNLNWDNLCDMALEDPTYAQKKAESLSSYVNLNKDYIWYLMTRFNGVQELRVILSFLEMIRLLRKNLAPALSTTDEVEKIYKDVANYLMNI